MRRIHELLHKSEQCLFDNEELILVKDGQLTALINDGECLTEVSMPINEEINSFLKRLKMND